MTAIEFFAIKFSLLVACLATLINLPLVLLTAHFLTRCKFKGKMLIEAVLIFPLVLPPLVTGYILLFIFSQNSLVGSFLDKFGVSLTFNLAAAVMASCVVSFPLMLRPIKLAMSSIDEGYLNISRSLGKNRLATFFRVILPMSKSGIISGSVLCFARSIGEFGATIMVAGNIPFKTTTISMAIFSFFNSVDGEFACFRLVLVSIFISLIALLVSEYYQKKGLKNA